MDCLDFCGNKLSVGDWVALSMESHTTLTYGKIISIKENCDKKITVGIEVNCFVKKWNRMGKGIRYRRSHNVIKISKELAVEKSLIE